MSKKIVALALVGSLALVLASACGGGGNPFDPNDPNNSSGGTSSGASGTSGSLGSSGSSGSSGSGDDSGLGECGAETQVAKQLPLDILIMLDASGSMMEQTGNGSGPTKWAAVKTALGSFISDPKSAGLGVGLQIFPIKHPGTPASCTTNAQCTVGGTSLGRCYLNACSPAAANTPLRSCDVAADCPGAAACRPLGECRLGILTSGTCLVGDPTYGSCLIGSCQAITSSTCDGAECVAADYTPARVTIATLPGNSGALNSSIASIPDPPPSALTPTSVAVQTGITLAKQHAVANPGHVVVSVLATDGFPTRCQPLDIPGIASMAATGAAGSPGTPAIKTFVIGVFADADKATATANLDAIAAGGDTSKAFIVTTSSNVAADFQKALESIRGQALPCEYSVPTAEAGTPDYDKVNVQRTSGAGATDVLGYKKNAGACDAAGGWYYDVDPSTGGTPTKIILCPTTCTAVKADTGAAKVDILLGCKTIVK